jgi:hypothetical protein
MTSSNIIRAKASVFLFGVIFLILTVGNVHCNREGEKPMGQKPIEEVLKNHTDHLMSIPGVVGTGIGEFEGKPCIKIFVIKKTEDLEKKIPRVLEGYKVVIDETGEIKALEPE